MKNKNNFETATLALGCFWCSQAIFARLRGVISVKPGYAGGIIPNPTYEQVCSGTTNHAETIQIEFNSNQISYDDILDIFWNIHDPTTLNKQGNDVGTQYRSIIFYHNDLQKRVAELSKEKLVKSHVYKNPVVTEILPYKNFYNAEIYHDNYYEKNKNLPYCNLVINPKIHKLLVQYSPHIKKEYKNRF